MAPLRAEVTLLNAEQAAAVALRAAVGQQLQQRDAPPGHRHGYPVCLPQHHPAVFQPVGDLRGNVQDRGAAQFLQERMVPGVQQIAVGDGGQPGPAGGAGSGGSSPSRYRRWRRCTDTLAPVRSCHRRANRSGRAYLGADARKRWYEHFSELAGRLAGQGGHREPESRGATERSSRPGPVRPPAQQRRLAHRRLAGPLQPLGDSQQQVVLDRAGAQETADPLSTWQVRALAGG